jgi:DNA polymerase III subunit epsilon
MRQIVLDTETTGLAPEEGHRIIELGCIEICNRRVSEQRFQRYLNPEREIDIGAAEVHGLTLEKLREYPRFQEVALEFVEFIRGAELIIHNAPFDVGFINHELSLLGEAWGKLEDYCTVFDTLKFARERHPGQRNSLDALCKRYEIDNGHRNLHGALLDAELLADVYLALTGGQSAMELDSQARLGQQAGTASVATRKGPRQSRVISADPGELAAHHARLEGIARVSGGRCVWALEDA